MFMGLTRPHWHWSHKCTPAADVRRWTTPPLPPTPCRVRVTGPSSPPPHCPPRGGQLRCYVIPCGGAIRMASRTAWVFWSSLVGASLVSSLGLGSIACPHGGAHALISSDALAVLCSCGIGALVGTDPCSLPRRVAAWANAMQRRVS